MVAFKLPDNFVVWADNLGSWSIDYGAMEDYDIMLKCKGGLVSCKSFAFLPRFEALQEIPIQP